MKTAATSLLALGVAACGAPDSGSGLVEAERTFPRKPEEVWPATVDALRDFDLTIDASEHDSSGGRLEARRGDGDPVKVGVRSVDPDKAAVSIRLDPEHAGLAELILDRISLRLGTSAP